MAAVDAAASRRSCGAPPIPVMPASRTLELLTQVARTLGPARPSRASSTRKWARPDAVRLDELRAQAVDDRAQAELDLGLHEAAVSGLRSAAEARPLRESGPRRLLMTASAPIGSAGRGTARLPGVPPPTGDGPRAGAGREIRELERSIADRRAARHRCRASRAVRGYRLLERIGEGAFAVVYRATSRRSVEWSR